MRKVKSPVILMVIFIWIGFVCAISFMEAWLKFQAPGITVPLGLGIGSLVFNALNKVEWAFAIIVIAVKLLSKDRSIFPDYILFFSALFILIVQTSWLLPVLDTRAEMIISGKNPPSSHLHFYYVGSELLKVVSLLSFGIKLFK